MSEAKLNEYRQQYKMAGANKQKPARPEDAAILAPEPDMTNPALIQLLMDAEREGNRFLYTNIPEVDLLDQCSGGHKKVTRLIRLAYDLSKFGAQRATGEIACKQANVLADGWAMMGNTHTYPLELATNNCVEPRGTADDIGR